MRIRVPATSANLGPGFDSCGIAVAMYLYLDVLLDKKCDEWFIEHELSTEIPHDETNLIIQTALRLVPELEPRKLIMKTTIPTARGLGSSSTAIVAGIELANRLGQLNLSMEEKINIATEIEGHPDNVAPAICGDFVVASYDQEVDFVKYHFPSCDLIAFIPNNELLTSTSRGVLPNNLKYKEAVKASSISNVMLAAIMTHNLELAGKMMQKDLWHEKYRAPLIPQLKEIRQLAEEVGLYGCVLSGAGPTILMFSPNEKTDLMVARLKEASISGTVEVLAIDREGLQVF